MHCLQVVSKFVLSLIGSRGVRMWDPFGNIPPTIKQSGLMLLILMCGDVAMNPGPVMLGSVNGRSIRNKDPLLSDTIASHAFDFLCLTETHIRATDSDSFLRSLTPDGFSLIHRPCSSGIGGVGFFIRESHKYRKVDTPNYCSFENIFISISVSCRTLLLAFIYRPPGPLTIPLTCTVISLISFFPPVIKICTYMLTSVNSYLIMQSLNVLLTFLPLLLTVKQEFPIGGTIV